MLRDENYRNEPLPPDLLFKRCVRWNRLLPPIEFCADCGTWHDSTTDCIMEEYEGLNGTS